jgi:2-dehydro-3-deoxy-D-arabinonate dehydratase
MKLYKTIHGALLEHHGEFIHIHEDWDILINRDDLETHLQSAAQNAATIVDYQTWLAPGSLLPPIGTQEVWAAGVTYLKSRDARMEESETAASLYDMVYDAARPELFFKAVASRVSGHGGEVYIRNDSSWDVPEPELTLFINSGGKIQGYTIGNDMSSRSIEGENALYLPQAKIYEKSAALGPCLYVASQPMDPSAVIRMNIKRHGLEAYRDETTVSRIKRSFEELTGYLFSECDFPQGCFLMTGTCLVPPLTFTLQQGDVVEINIDYIGTMVNTINVNPKHQKPLS